MPPIFSKTISGRGVQFLEHFQTVRKLNTVARRLLSTNFQKTYVKQVASFNQISGTSGLVGTPSGRQNWNDSCIVLLQRDLHLTSKCRNIKTDQQPPGKKPKDEDDKDDNKDGPFGNSPASKLLTYGVFMGIYLCLYVYMSNGMKQQPSRPIEWNQFVNEFLKKGEVQRLYAHKGIDEVHVRLHPGAVVGGKPSERIDLRVNVDHQHLEEKVRAVEKQLGIPPSQSLPIVWKDFSNAVMMAKLVFWLGIGALIYYMAKKVKVNIKVMNPFEGMSKMSYTRGDLANAARPTVKFSDIAGMHEAKMEIKEYVEYLKNPSRFQNLGARIPCGALLLGPPGCGKTLLAKAVAAESEVPFLVMAGSDFVEMIGGLGASRMRSLFKDARGLKPCIIYIDEIDALGKTRSNSEGGAGGGGGESEQTLNQLLVEMDGMTDNSGVVMLASTNRADVLDKALLRPGRFDRHINIDLPTLIERKELFEMYLKKINLKKPLGDFLDFLAQATPGMSGADIANVCNEAALHAARDGSETVKESNISHALDRVIGGQAKTSSSISQSERKTIAYHECGHVLVSWLLEHTDALVKVSIIPRTSATLGFAQYMPSDKKLYSREDLFQRMCVILGGRAAETIVFNRITTGAEDDLDRVRELAYNQIKKYGMGDSVGLLSFRSDKGDDYQTKPYSKYLQRQMDMEAQQLIAQAYKMAEKLIIENRQKLDKLCQLLLKQEEMTYNDIEAAIGPPPYGDKKKIDILSV